MLQFNPSKRLTAVQALNHKFLADFVNKKEDIEFKGKIKFDVSDNVRLSTGDYKKLIYGIATVEESFESPKKFSDLRKLSVNKESKNSSNAVLQPKKPCQNDTLSRLAGSPKAVFHRPVPKASSPNSFKDIIQQEK